MFNIFGKGNGVFPVCRGVAGFLFEQIKEQFYADPALLYRSNLAVLTGDAGMRRAGTELVIRL